MNERRQYRFVFMTNNGPQERLFYLSDLVSMGQSHVMNPECRQNPIGDVITFERKAAILDGLVDLFEKSIEQGSFPSIRMQADPNEVATGVRKLVWILKAFRQTGISYAMDTALAIEGAVDRRTWPERIVDALEDLVKAGRIAEETARAKEE